MPRVDTSSTHQLYLAVIVALILVLVFVIAKAVEARSTLKDIEKRFGLDSDLRAAPPRHEALRPLAAEELLRPRTYDQYRDEVDHLIERAGELGDFGDRGALPEACLQALRGGKRLRSIVLLEIARQIAVSQRIVAPAIVPVDPADAALFIECLHASSLVVDDLPEFDNDVVRRGQPSTHAKHGRATAQLVALRLMAASFLNVSRQIDWLRDNCPSAVNPDRTGARVLGRLSEAVGGAADGQFMDAVTPVDELFDTFGEEAVLELVQKKTATIFEVAFIAGWLFGGGGADETESLQLAGRHFGTAFQIADDLGDQADDARRQEDGKPGWNFATIYGEKAARRVIKQNLNACRRIMKERGLFSELWTEIYSKVWEMADKPEILDKPDTPAAPDTPASD